MRQRRRHRREHRAGGGLGDRGRPEALQQKQQALKHFASWLRLGPGTKISGGKTLSGRTLPSSNRAAHKLARLIYAMLSRGDEYADQGQA